MSKRQYSDNDKANALAALAANGGNVNHTARQLGLPEANLRKWSKGLNLNPEVVQISEEKKESLADALEDLALKLVEGIPGMIAGAKLNEAGVTLGIVVDKMELLRGNPTSRLSSLIEPLEKPLRELSDDELAERRDALDRFRSVDRSGNRSNRDRRRGAA